MAEPILGQGYNARGRQCGFHRMKFSLLDYLRECFTTQPRPSVEMAPKIWWNLLISKFYIWTVRIIEGQFLQGTQCLLGPKLSPCEERTHNPECSLTCPTHVSSVAWGPFLLVGALFIAQEAVKQGWLRAYTLLYSQAVWVWLLLLQLLMDLEWVFLGSVSQFLIYKIKTVVVTTSMGCCKD